MYIYVCIYIYIHINMYDVYIHAYMRERTGKRLRTVRCVCSLARCAREREAASANAPLARLLTCVSFTVLCTTYKIL